MENASILVVDDEPEILDLLRECFEGEGYKVLSAIDGEKAIQSVVDHLPDLVVLDIVMPKKNGIEVLHHLRGNYSMPVIMLSASFDTDEKNRCIKIGAADYISKPFHVVELLSRVGIVMGQYYKGRFS
ncbi:MAG: response regulator [Dehalococcoidales bacterium]|nr:response regulator [Dehalococcoidales bacterium]